jgi:hypothetical protein
VESTGNRKAVIPGEQEEKEERNPGLSVDAFPALPPSNDMLQEAEITIYLHVTNNVRVYELTFVFSF